MPVSIFSQTVTPARPQCSSQDHSTESPDERPGTDADHDVENPFSEGEPRHGQAIGSVQAPGNRQQTVAIGIRLDHGHHPGAPCPVFDGLEVVANCAEPDERPSPETH